LGSATEENAKQHGRRSLSSKDMPTAVDEGTLADAESEDDDLDEVKEEDRPIEARVRFKYPDRSNGVMQSTSMLSKTQHELSVAVAEADSKAMRAVSMKSSTEPIGTRLTMTSRTGYFQDRIISPSMVCVVLDYANVCRSLTILLCEDACDGYPLYWPTSVSRFCDRLPYFAHPNAKPSTCAVSSSVDAVWGERSVCG
jgi:hypothetical protein